MFLDFDAPAPGDRGIEPICCLVIWISLSVRLQTFITLPLPEWVSCLSVWVTRLLWIGGRVAVVVDGRAEMAIRNSDDISIVVLI